MATWGELARDSRQAAYETFVKQRWRTCASRAYYAVYSAATEALIQQGVTMPKGRNNPSHVRIPALIGNCLVGISHSLRWRLAKLVERLYNLRVVADYKPHASMGQPDAWLALGLMNEAFRCLKR